MYLFLYLLTGTSDFFFVAVVGVELKRANPVLSLYKSLFITYYWAV